MDDVFFKGSLAAADLGGSLGQCVPLAGPNYEVAKLTFKDFLGAWGLPV